MTLLKRFRLASTLNILGFGSRFRRIHRYPDAGKLRTGIRQIPPKADRIYRLEGLNTDHERAYFASTHSRPCDRRIHPFLATSDRHTGSRLGTEIHHDRTQRGENRFLRIFTALLPRDRRFSTSK
ncbi:MAG: hypothetical protein ACLR8Y_16580 [Alistipes indistinctus]